MAIQLVGWAFASLLKTERFYDITGSFTFVTLSMLSLQKNASPAPRQARQYAAYFCTHSRWRERRSLSQPFLPTTFRCRRRRLCCSPLVCSGAPVMHSPRVPRGFCDAHTSRGAWPFTIRVTRHPRAAPRSAVQMMLPFSVPSNPTPSCRDSLRRPADDAYSDGEFVGCAPGHLPADPYPPGGQGPPVQQRARQSETVPRLLGRPGAWKGPELSKRCKACGAARVRSLRVGATLMLAYRRTR